jgi:DNA repair protein RAD50
VTELALDDLDRFYRALDQVSEHIAGHLMHQLDTAQALIRFHATKMAEINKIIKELWQVTYKGNDIDSIAIRSSEDAGDSTYAE